MRICPAPGEGRLASPRRGTSPGVRATRLLVRTACSGEPCDREGLCPIRAKVGTGEGFAPSGPPPPKARGLWKPILGVGQSGVFAWAGRSSCPAPSVLLNTMPGVTSRVQRHRPGPTPIQGVQRPLGLWWGGLEGQSPFNLPSRPSNKAAGAGHHGERTDASPRQATLDFGRCFWYVPAINGRYASAVKFAPNHVKSLKS